MKHHYAIHAVFHNVPAKDAHQSAKITANNPRLACNEGLKEILRRDGIKGRQHKKMVVSILRVDKGVEDSGQSDT